MGNNRRYASARNSLPGPNTLIAGIVKSMPDDGIATVTDICSVAGINARSVRALISAAVERIFIQPVYPKHHSPQAYKLTPIGKLAKQHFLTEMQNNVGSRKHTPESRRKIGYASKARADELMRERGRVMCLQFAEQKRVIFTPEMTKALLSMNKKGANREYMAQEIGVCIDLIHRELRSNVDLYDLCNLVKPKKELVS